MAKKFPLVNFIALNIDKDNSRVKHYLDKNEIPIPTYRDPKGILTKTTNYNVAPYWAIFHWNQKTNAWENTVKESGFDMEKIEIAFKRNSQSKNDSRMIASKKGLNPKKRGKK